MPQDVPSSVAIEMTAKAAERHLRPERRHSQTCEPHPSVPVSQPAGAGTLGFAEPLPLIPEKQSWLSIKSCHYGSSIRGEGAFYPLPAMRSEDIGSIQRVVGAGLEHRRLRPRWVHFQRPRLSPLGRTAISAAENIARASLSPIIQHRAHITHFHD